MRDFPLPLHMICHMAGKLPMFFHDFPIKSLVISHCSSETPYIVLQLIGRMIRLKKTKNNKNCKNCWIPTNKHWYCHVLPLSCWFTWNWRQMLNSTCNFSALFSHGPNGRNVSLLFSNTWMLIGCRLSWVELFFWQRRWCCSQIRVFISGLCDAFVVFNYLWSSKTSELLQVKWWYWKPSQSWGTLQVENSQTLAFAKRQYVML